MSFKTFQGDRLVQLLARASLPTIKGWNRLEGRPRTADFDRTLQARIRDPLWMLTRQWQMGEFRGEDAGSPIFARVKMATTRIDRYRVRAEPTSSYDEAVPLEARVERQELPLDLALGLQVARHWSRLLARAFSEGRLSKDFRQDFRDAMPVSLPPRDDAAGADVYPHQEVWQLYAASEGQLDGREILRRLRTGEDLLTGIDPGGDEPALRDLEQRLRAWLERQYSLPATPADDAWAPAYLEYQFACSAPDFDGDGQIVLLADEYHRGHLDWHSFDRHPTEEALAAPADELPPDFEPPAERAFDFVPTVIEFAGMPNVRWWEFENRKTHFGDIDAHTTDLAKLLLIEFGLIYANDWFMLPYEVPVGSLARVDGLAVTNVFGERIWIDAAGGGEQDDWQRWAMYNLNVRGEDGPADLSIFVPPAVDRLQESRPREEVRMIRDEVANMVWGVESRVALADGGSREGSEAAAERLHYLEGLLAAEAPAEDEAERPQGEARIRYLLMSAVPEHWIPFIPVRMPGNGADNRQIQLQRAAMLRILDGTEDRPQIRPRTGILSHNSGGAYFVHEEEVPRAGARITQTFQRARWHDGKVCVWLGRRKRTGRGEGSSGLAFDQIRPERRRRRRN